jgi:O-antigen ligase
MQQLSHMRGSQLRTPPASRMSGRAALQAVEPYVTALAIALVPLRNAHPAQLFFTISDFIFCISLLLVAASGRIHRAPYRELTLFWLGGLAMLGGGLMLCSIVWGNGFRGLVVVGQYVFSYYLLGLLLVGRDLPTLQFFLKVWVAAIVSVNILGLYSYMTGFEIYTSPNSYLFVSGNKRLQTTLGDPNASANVVALTMPLILYLWYNNQIKTKLLALILPILLIAVVFTSSVNGLVCNVVSLGLFFLLKLNWRLLLGSVILVVGATAFVSEAGEEYLPKAFQKRVLSALEEGELEKAGSFSDRFTLLGEAAAMIDRNPFTGTGADQFRNYTESGLPVHNAYLLVWVEGGLVALVGWFLLLATPVLAAIQNFVVSASRTVSITTFGIGLVFATIAINNAHMYARFWLVPLQFALAIAIAQRTGAANCASAGASRRRVR